MCSVVIITLSPHTHAVILADLAQLVECVLGKDEVTGSNPVVGSLVSEIFGSARLSKNRVCLPPTGRILLISAPCV